MQNVVVELFGRP